MNTENDDSTEKRLPRRPGYEIKFDYYGETCIVKFDDSDKTIKAVFEKLIQDYYFKYKSFSGESIMQSDNPQIYAPEVLSEIADDIIKFDVNWEPKVKP